MTKLLQQALDALITSMAYVDAKPAITEVQDALRAIEQALAQQEQRINVPVAHKLAKEQAKTDQTVPPEYLAWLESLYPERNGVGGNEAWNAGIAWFKAQQEQPASVDAYVGAREDAAIWKKRALEAEELNRKFIAELNGPTYLGEPAQQEQPSQELASQTASTNPVVSQKAAGTVDKDCGNCKKFSTNSLTGGPVCISCKDYSNWEPKP